MTFFTTNLNQLQYRIAMQRVEAGGRLFEVHVAVPTEPLDFALDNFRAIEKGTVPLLILFASLLIYWQSGRWLAPVTRIVETADRTGVQNLSRRLEVPRAVMSCAALPKHSTRCFSALKPRSRELRGSPRTRRTICERPEPLSARSQKSPCADRAWEANTSTAVNLARDGAHVFLTGRCAQRLVEGAQSIRWDGGRASLETLDLR